MEVVIMSNNKMTNKEMLQQIMNTMGTINSRLDSIESRVSALEKSKPSTYGGYPTVSGKGGIKTTKEKDTRTWSEKKSEWASQKYTEAERKAYGEQKRAEREKQHKAYELTNKCFTERVSKAEWRKKYNEILATL